MSEWRQGEHGEWIRPVGDSTIDLEVFADEMEGWPPAQDAVWLAQLARGSSWPGEMAQRVEDAARRVIDLFGTEAQKKAQRTAGAPHGPDAGRPGPPNPTT